MWCCMSRYRQTCWKRPYSTLVILALLTVTWDAAFLF